MAKRTKKHATVILMVGTRGRETTHRGSTLKTALAIGVRSQIPSDCHVKWGKVHKLATMAGGEGQLVCSRNRLNGERVRFVAIRTRGRKLGRPHKGRRS